MRPLDAALQYATRGWAVFPLPAGSKEPFPRGVLADDQGRGGFYVATTDLELIRQWWARWPRANVAVATEASGLVCVDVDVKDRHQGMAEWQAIRESLGHEIAQTITQRTPTGGLHVLYGANGHKIKSVGDIRDGIETKAVGGYAVMAPSRTTDGGYTDVAGYGFGETELLDLPESLAELLTPIEKPRGRALSDSERIPKGRRNAMLASMAGHMRAGGFTKPQIETALLEVNATRCDPPLSEAEVRRIAGSIAQYDPAVDAELLQFPADDEGNALAVKAVHGSGVLFCEVYGWLRWNGRYWDSTDAEAYLDRAIVETLTRRRVAAVKANVEGIVKASRASAYNVRACKYLLRSHCVAQATDFDADPDRINCQNGIVDLRCGELEPHSPDRRFTYCVPLDFDIDADFMTWTDFLSEVTGNRGELVEYLQEAVGYSLTGRTREECVFYVQGPTRAGKGVFAETLIAAFGGLPLATEVDFTTFTMRRDRDSQNFDLAPLKPCRFVTASESGKYQTLNEAVLKRATGGNYIRCAFKHKDHFTYRPAFKLWLSSNFPVNADVDDDAVWARLRVIEFPNCYTGKEDKLLKDKLTRPEVLRGVLGWAVLGAVRWYGYGGHGLEVPKPVREATDTARHALDYVGQWIEDCLMITRNPDDFLSNEGLYGSYERWCQSNGVKPKGKRTLTIALKRKKLDAGKPKKIEGVNYRGCEGVKWAITEK